MDYHQIKKAYARLSPVYDVVFDRVFYPGRVKAVELLEIKPGNLILEVGIGTGLNLPLYPSHCRLIGIDISEEMLERAKERVEELNLRHITLTLMDASCLGFPDSTFDHVLATYTISAVPDPVRTLLEMKRVCREGGYIVILNHFKSENSIMGTLEELVSPICTKLGGFKSDLELGPLLREAKLNIEQHHRVNLFNGWHLIRCINEK
ncbi:MAG: class I SAM-dependent methyltransferase [Candidatus Methylomirabilales bacterium]